jgi:hypothetical protein
MYTVLLDREAGHYLGNGMTCSFDRNLVCSDRTNLNCYEVMASTGDFAMVIITLGSHYSVLSCQLALPMPHPWRVADVQTINLICAMSNQGVGFKVFWTQALSGFKVHERLPRGETRP